MSPSCAPSFKKSCSLLWFSIKINEPCVFRIYVFSTTSVRYESIVTTVFYTMIQTICLVFLQVKSHRFGDAFGTFDQDESVPPFRFLSSSLEGTLNLNYSWLLIYTFFSMIHKWFGPCNRVYLPHCVGFDFDEFKQSLVSLAMLKFGFTLHKPT